VAESIDNPRGPHDLGGTPAGPIDRSEHEPALWELRVDAMRQLLGEQGLLSADELRRGIEALGEEKYSRLGYYERWIESITENLLRRGVITTAELADRLESG